VRLHQPASFYGVESRELAREGVDAHGPNRGFLSLSEGPEIVAYLHAVLRDRLLPSGRVEFLPLTEVQPDGTLRHLLSGRRESVNVRRKTVDASWLTNSVPRTHMRQFSVAPGATCVPPSELPRLAAGFEHYAVLGAGKTALDACCWLRTHGVPPDVITWAAPRDSWFVNRAMIQPALPFFDATFGSIVAQREAMAAATSADDLALRMEACGAWLRLDRAITPTMFHYATVSEGELALLRTIGEGGRIVRQGRVQAIEPGRLRMQHGDDVVLPAQTLFIDCTASAITQRATRPVFDGKRITLQMIRMPQPTFSAACIAFIEATLGDMSDDEKNRFTAPIPLPDTVAEVPLAQLIDNMNRFHAARHPALRDWMNRSRLDGYAHLVAAVDAADSAKLALLARMREVTKAAMANLPRLAAGRAA
jgi:hypothetical protein